VTTRSFIAPVEADLRRMDERIRQSGEDDFPWLGTVLGHILNTSGKRLRPIITLLTGHIYEYNEDLHVPMAAGVELLHIASLVHDDTVDKASLRRGRVTINAQWGDHVAVLLGDFLFAKSAEMVTSTGNMRVTQLFAHTLRQLSSGELREMYASFNWDLGQQFYWERISRKTASLFTTAAQSGAILGGAPEAHIAAMKDFGQYLGLAFQVVDDILDFEGLEQEVGKPVGNDLAQGVLTLPAIIYLERYADGLKGKLDGAFWKDREKVASLIEAVRSSPAIQDSYKAADDYCERARAAISPISDSLHRRALLDIVDYAAARTK